MGDQRKALESFQRELAVFQKGKKKGDDEPGYVDSDGEIARVKIPVPCDISIFGGDTRHETPDTRH